MFLVAALVGGGILSVYWKVVANNTP